MKLFKVTHKFEEAGDRGPNFQTTHVIAAMAASKTEAIEMAKEIDTRRTEYADKPDTWTAEEAPRDAFVVKL